MGIYKTMILRRADKQIYLYRWRFALKRIGGIYLHRMDAPDPGMDLHDHPWTFISIVLWGGYTEERTEARLAPAIAAQFPNGPRGRLIRRRIGSIRRMRLDECHRIIQLHGRRCWTLVLGGPVRRKWGFYLLSGYMDERTYDDTVRVNRRDLWAEGGYVESRLREKS